MSSRGKGRGEEGIGHEEKLFSSYEIMLSTCDTLYRFDIDDTDLK